MPTKKAFAKITELIGLLNQLETTQADIIRLLEANRDELNDTENRLLDANTELMADVRKGLARIEQFERELVSQQ